ncbi:MAG: winged helix-turn-helix domain-containing protein [Rhodospirillales bacterium]|nr:winged helix-turn-helix domain-containing protein [Rhodospirillales bacterium]MCB9997033.1 winged helix-turn-helix domain-containing protein [Rhodospirillales bacterium]
MNKPISEQALAGLVIADPLLRRLLERVLIEDGLPCAALEAVRDEDVPGLRVLVLDHKAAVPSLSCEPALIRIGPRAAGEESVQEEWLETPLRLGAFLERVRFYCRQNTAIKRCDVQVGPYRLLWDTMMLVAEGRADIRLTEKERDILAVLSRSAGRTVSRHDLLDTVWAYAADIETHTLETHIYRLRQKIEDDPAQPSYVLTEENGYRLV